ncbi:PP2C family protein-serine/threonine phosphatase [Kineococcus sp. DHX-1]|uniref:PP2C family protein-serine/threonine phosphatase n=1 Tax=Kineococcus sp. DHX-1 TaxID=3349638 RepID=UPI0036D2AEF2
MTRSQAPARDGRGPTVVPGPGGLDGLLLSALRAAEQAVCVADVSLPDEPVVWVNEAFTRTTGYDASQTVGRNCRFLQDGLSERGYDVSTPAAQIRSLVERRAGGTVLIPNRRRDGSVFCNELALSPLPDETGAVRYYVAVQQDVTARVQAQSARDAVQAEAAELADHLQRQLVPQELPEVTGWEVAVRYRPATRADGSRGEVSGDFYDLRVLASGEAVAVIGDVSGRGPAAAATTAALRWAVRGVLGVVSGPADALRHVGGAVHDTLGDRFATVATVRLPSGDATACPPVDLCLAGHPRPVLVPVAGPSRMVGDPGMLLGPFPDPDLSETPVDLAPGEHLVLYTDGVTEAASPAHELFGDERLLAALDALRDKESAAPDEVADAVLAAVGDHVGDGPTDDLTLMVLRRSPR